MGKIRDIMTPAPTSMSRTESVASAARVMRDAGIGTVLVLDDGRVHGIVTDRDIVVRALAEGGDPEVTQLGDICSAGLITLSPDDDVAEANRLVREHTIHRIPVVEDGTTVGIVSTGDLAIWQDEGSVLGGIAAAPPST